MNSYAGKKAWGCARTRARTRTWRSNRVESSKSDSIARGVVRWRNRWAGSPHLRVATGAAEARRTGPCFGTPTSLFTRPAPIRRTENYYTPCSREFPCNPKVGIGEEDGNCLHFGLTLLHFTNLFLTPTARGNHTMALCDTQVPKCQT